VAFGPRRAVDVSDLTVRRKMQVSELRRCEAFRGVSREDSSAVVAIQRIKKRLKRKREARERENIVENFFSESTRVLIRNSRFSGKVC
jgi:hypothetical protein